MVHFYDEITPTKLFGILTGHLDDFGTILGAINRWLSRNPPRVQGGA